MIRPNVRKKYVTKGILKWQFRSVAGKIFSVSKIESVCRIQKFVLECSVASLKLMANKTRNINFFLINYYRVRCITKPAL